MDSIQPDSAKTDGTREKLMSEMQAVINQAENWLRSAGAATNDEFRSARAQFEATLSTAKGELMELEHRVIDSTMDAAKATDEYVHANPWKSVGMGAAVGIICGLLITRK